MYISLAFYLLLLTKINTKSDQRSNYETNEKEVNVGISDTYYLTEFEV